MNLKFVSLPDFRDFGVVYKPYITWQGSPGPYCDWFLIGRDFAIQNGHKPCIYILENRQNQNL